jgi:hypothetical protein
MLFEHAKAAGAATGRLGWGLKKRNAPSPPSLAKFRATAKAVDRHHGNGKALLAATADIDTNRKRAPKQLPCPTVGHARATRLFLPFWRRCLRGLEAPIAAMDFLNRVL